MSGINWAGVLFLTALTALPVAVFIEAYREHRRNKRRSERLHRQIPTWEEYRK